MRISRVLLSLFGLLLHIEMQAQIGYQVSLLNSATGEPRANVSVEAEVTITNSDDEEIYKGTQRATSNDLGVVQLKVGNQGTFKDVNWNKLPFFIEVSVDGTVIGKSQILTVPIAEAAKYLAPGIDIDDLVGTWSYYSSRNDDVYSLTFRRDFSGTFNVKAQEEQCSYEKQFTYEIEGKNLMIYYSDRMSILRYYKGKFYSDSEEVYTR